MRGCDTHNSLHMFPENLEVSASEDNTYPVSMQKEML